MSVETVGVDSAVSSLRREGGVGRETPVLAIVLRMRVIETRSKVLRVRQHTTEEQERVEGRSKRKEYALYDAE